ncbi:uncharacterized protein B0I36DRAFT_355156 [Microdochium trichocladiopsis]|uniref:Uncharacterized protein n=1 Tax=Microdochium trichocladiopsis TaxID=1682393 RepID=A0A9P8XT99_9PEZI|nr:uncharacterized protein B0I36DRAFT_355156 [Microdochium trichocladiopsis]KAH7016350.1 hypothetical protein B0I36DRAFT_355156 [Microdochium trichocladiopsis]
MAPPRSELEQQRRLWVRQKTFRQRNMTPGQKWLDSVLDDGRFKPKRHSVIPTALGDVLGTLIHDIFHGVPYELLPYKSRNSKPVTIGTERFSDFQSLYRKTNQEAHVHFTNRLDEASFTNFQKQHGPRLVEILRKRHLGGKDGWLCESEVFTCLQLLLETVPKQCIMAPDEAVIPAIEGKPLQLFDDKFLSQDDNWSCGYWMLEIVRRICFQKGLLEQNCKAPTALISAGGSKGVDPLLDFIRSAININITEDHLDNTILPGEASDALYKRDKGRDNWHSIDLWAIHADELDVEKDKLERVSAGARWTEVNHVQL